MGAAALIAAACARTDEHGTQNGASTASVRPVAASGASANVIPSCPATGLWSECAVFQRLDRAGLAPRRDSSANVSEAPLTARGTLLRIANSEVEIYLYESASARERDEAKLERSRYLSADAPVSMQTLATLIHSANLIAILHSRNDHQRERVSDALTAGPPQR